MTTSNGKWLATPHRNKRKWRKVSNHVLGEVPTHAGRVCGPDTDVSYADGLRNRRVPQAIEVAWPAHFSRPLKLSRDFAWPTFHWQISTWEFHVPGNYLVNLTPLHLPRSNTNFRELNFLGWSIQTLNWRTKRLIPAQHLALFKYIRAKF